MTFRIFVSVFVLAWSLSSFNFNFKFQFWHLNRTTLYIFKRFIHGLSILGANIYIPLYCFIFILYLVIFARLQLRFELLFRSFRGCCLAFWRSLRNKDGNASDIKITALWRYVYVRWLFKWWLSLSVLFLLECLSVCWVYLLSFLSRLWTRLVLNSAWNVIICSNLGFLRRLLSIHDWLFVDNIEMSLSLWIRICLLSHFKTTTRCN